MRNRGIRTRSLTQHMAQPPALSLQERTSPWSTNETLAVTRLGGRHPGRTARGGAWGEAAAVGTEHGGRRRPRRAPFGNRRQRTDPILGRCLDPIMPLPQAWVLWGHQTQAGGKVQEAPLPPPSPPLSLTHRDGEVGGGGTWGFQGGASQKKQATPTVGGVRWDSEPNTASNPWPAQSLGGPLSPSGTAGRVLLAGVEMTI